MGAIDDILRNVGDMESTRTLFTESADVRNAFGHCDLGGLGREPGRRKLQADA